MLLLLIRHAQAAEQDEAKYPDDSLRPLVPKGRKVQRRMTKQLRRRDLVPSRVFSSPWKRAWQTARIVVVGSGLPKEARLPCHALAGPPDLAALAAELGEIGADETIALVGHEPWMGGLASLLLTGRTSGLSVDFPKSGILGIERSSLASEAGAGSLRCFLIP